MLDVVREYSYEVEYYSIDEFFFRVVPRPRESFEDQARSIQGEILERVGVPVSIGIGRRGRRPMI